MYVGVSVWLGWSGIRAAGFSLQHEIYPSPSIVRMIKSRRMRLLGHVARMKDRRGIYRVLVGKTGGKRPLGRSRDGRIKVRWIFRKWV